jgi:hypothetical protein
MHCPSCGKESTSEKYCRSCGMDLEAVSKLVASHLSPEELKAFRDESEKAVLARMVKWMMWGFLVLGIGLIFLITQKTFVQDRLIGLLASIFILGGTGIAGYGVLAAIRDGAKTRRSVTEPNIQPKEISAAKTTASLPEERIPLPVPSVAERTTELLARKEVSK